MILEANTRKIDFVCHVFRLMHLISTKKLNNGLTIDYGLYNFGFELVLYVDVIWRWPIACNACNLTKGMFIWAAAFEKQL
jgi:hypothetical protein